MREGGTAVTVRWAALTAAAILAMSAADLARGATADLTGVVEQELAIYSVKRIQGSRASGTISVVVKPFHTEEAYKGENIGALAAEIVIKHLQGLKRLNVLSEANGGEAQGASDSDQIQAAISSSGVEVTGDVIHRDGSYELTVSFTDRSRGQPIGARQLTIPEKKFRSMLDRHLRWKHRVWSVQPYLQAMYTERYLADGYPERLVTSSYMGVNVSALIEPARMAIDETAEFTGGLRVTYRKAVMLDLAYIAHGHSTSEGQYIVTMTNTYNPVNATHLLTYVNTSAVSASLCGTARLYGDLHGYAGAGCERTTAAQTVSSMSRLLFTVSGGGVTEVRGFFLSPDGALAGGGTIRQRAYLPFIRTGIEWRPRRLGFNVLATYRLGNGDFKPLAMAVEQLYSQNGSEPQTISQTTMEVTRFRLPRLSIGAAFTLSL